LFGVGAYASAMLFTKQKTAEDMYNLFLWGFAKVSRPCLVVLVRWLLCLGLRSGVGWLVFDSLISVLILSWVFFPCRRA